MLLLEQETTRKGWINKFLKLELNAIDKEYKIEVIKESIIYNKVVED